MEKYWKYIAIGVIAFLIGSATIASASHVQKFVIGDERSSNTARVNSAGKLRVDATGRVALTDGGGGRSTVIESNGGLRVQNRGGNVSVDNFPRTQRVQGSVRVQNFPRTQKVSGGVRVTNLPALQEVEVTNQGSLDPAAIVNLTFIRGVGEGDCAPGVPASYLVPDGKTLLVTDAGANWGTHYNGLWTDARGLILSGRTIQLRSPLVISPGETLCGFIDPGSVVSGFVTGQLVDAAPTASEPVTFEAAIAADGRDFLPHTIQIKPGDTVRWSYSPGLPTRILSGQRGEPDAGSLFDVEFDPQARILSVNHTFDQPGTYHFFLERADQPRAGGEECDGIDNDGDGEIDEEVPTCLIGTIVVE